MALVMGQKNVTNNEHLEATLALWLPFFVLQHIKPIVFAYDFFLL